MAHYVLFTTATGALVSSSGVTEPARTADQSVRRFEYNPAPGATWDSVSLDYSPKVAPHATGDVRSRQKLSGTLASTAYPQGRTVKTVPMPGFAVSDASKAFVQGFWWHVSAGTLAAIPAIFADVTGQNEITIVINSPVAQTLTLVVGGSVVEYV